MTEAASLSLLKGSKKTVAAELDKSPDVHEEDVSVEVDAMSSAELDAFVDENSLEVPDDWAKLDVEAKRDYLNKTYGDGEPAPAPAPKAKEPAKKAPAKKSKSKALAPASKDGEIVEPDVLQDLVHEIETMSEETALSSVSKLAEDAELTYFKLGGVLSVIRANEWHKSYGTFSDYVEKVHGLAHRRAMYWIEIYNCLANSGVEWEKVKGLGWTKLKEIARKAKNAAMRGIKVMTYPQFIETFLADVPVKAGTGVVNKYVDLAPKYAAAPSNLSQAQLALRDVL